MARTHVANNVYEYNGAFITAYPLTISAWFYTTGAPAGTQTLFGISRNNATQELFGLSVTAASTVNARCIAGGSGSAGGNSGAFSANTWNHGLGLYTSATSRTPYLNGTAGTTSLTNLTPASLDKTDIGGHYNSAGSIGSQFVGRLAHLAMWDVVLSQLEITALSRGVSPLAIRPANLKCYVPYFGDDTTEKDWVGFRSFDTPGSPANSPGAKSFDPNVNKHRFARQAGSMLIVPAAASSTSSSRTGNRHAAVPWRNQRGRSNTFRRKIDLPRVHSGVVHAPAPKPEVTVAKTVEKIVLAPDRATVEAEILEFVKDRAGRQESQPALPELPRPEPLTEPAPLPMETAGVQAAARVERARAEFERRERDDAEVLMLVNLLEGL